MIDVGGAISGILEGLLHIILDFVIYIVNILLLPIDTLLNSLIPNYSDVLQYVYNFFTYALTYISYIIDSFGLYSFTVVLLIDFIIFKLTVPLQVWLVKLAISWYNKLKT